VPGSVADAVALFAAMTTLHPCDASASAVARPIPREAPVMSATRPRSSSRATFAIVIVRGGGGGEQCRSDNVRAADVTSALAASAASTTAMRAVRARAAAPRGSVLALARGARAVRARATARDRGAVLAIEKVRADVFVMTTASGRACALALVDDGDGGKGLVFGDDIIGGERGGDERARGPFWCSAALGEAGGVVAFGSSGNHLVCADVDGDGVMTYPVCGRWCIRGRCAARIRARATLYRVGFGTTRRGRYSRRPSANT
jgi:hypothetical protein